MTHDTHPGTMDGFYEAVRDTAYFLWQDAGEPQERSDEFWFRALDIHYRSRAYGIWMRQLQNQDFSIDREPVGDISSTDLSDDESEALATSIEQERDA